MDEIMRKLSAEGQGVSGPMMARPWTIRERLEAQQADLTQRLERCNAALAALDSEPGVAAALEAVFKAL